MLFDRPEEWQATKREELEAARAEGSCAARGRLRGAGQRALAEGPARWARESRGAWSRLWVLSYRFGAGPEGVPARENCEPTESLILAQIERWRRG